ncbi:MAG: N-(5-phosphoribosyl)anthranilate isomerase, partial [Pseudomonadota bacterium]
MTVRIKFCGLVRKQDIAFAKSLAVDYIGLVLYAKSPRALNLEQAFALRREVGSSMQCVGLFVNAHPAYVHAAHRRLGLDVIQFHGDESAKQCFASSPIRFWRAVRMQHPKSLELAMQAFASEGRHAGGELAPHRMTAALATCEAFLVDADAKLAYGGSGHVFDWTWLGQSERRPDRLILSGGLNGDNVSEAIKALRPWAVDVSSGIQGASPSVKDAGKMEVFVNLVRASEQAVLTKRP